MNRLQRPRFYHRDPFHVVGPNQKMKVSMNTGFKVFGVLWVFCFLLSLVVMIGLAVVAIHFIAKAW